MVRAESGWLGRATRAMVAWALAKPEPSSDQIIAFSAGDAPLLCPPIPTVIARAPLPALPDTPPRHQLARIARSRRTLRHAGPRHVHRPTRAGTHTVFHA